MSFQGPRCNKSRTSRETEFDAFDTEIHRRLKEDDFVNEGDNPNPGDWSEFMNHDEDFQVEFDRVFNNDNIPEADDTFTPYTYDDNYLNMELAITRGNDGPEYAQVTKRLKDNNGFPIGIANQNPIIDTRMYEVEYQDGYKASLTANAIVHNLFAQVYKEGNRHVLFDEILDHRTNGLEIKQKDAFVMNKTGTKRRKETTQGHDLLLGWKDGISTWVALKDSKEAYPVQVEEYDVHSKLAHDPDFTC